MHQQQTPFENIVFPQCFLLNQIIVSPFVQIFDNISLFAAELKEPKIGVSGKGLRMVGENGPWKSRVLAPPDQLGFSEPWPSTGETQKIPEYVSCRCDMSENKC